MKKGDSLSGVVFVDIVVVIAVVVVVVIVVIVVVALVVVVVVVIVIVVLVVVHLSTMTRLYSHKVRCSRKPIETLNLRHCVN